MNVLLGIRKPNYTHSTAGIKSHAKLFTSVRLILVYPFRILQRSIKEQRVRFAPALRNWAKSNRLRENIRENIINMSSAYWKNYLNIPSKGATGAAERFPNPFNSSYAIAAPKGAENSS